jgi:iron complex transport system substrate-binding protein
MPPTAVLPLHRRLLGGVALAAVLVLTACGGGDDDASKTTSASTAATDAFPARIAHKFGTTTVPSEPERVVAVGYNDQDFALALGVKPVGGRQFLGGSDISKRPWAQKALGGSKPELIGAQELNLERIAALRPDVILGIYSGITKEQYGLLSKIAPTVAQTDAFADFGEPWQQQTLQTGQALGRTEQAKKVVADTEARIAEVKGEEDFTGKTLVMASGSTSQFAVYSSQDLRPRFFAGLGFQTPKRIDRMAGKRFYANVSEEQLNVVDADVVVVYGTEKELLKKPAFAALRVVKEGRVIYLDQTSDLANALGFSSPLSIPYAIDGFLPQLRAAVDGDPATKVPAAAR